MRRWLLLGLLPLLVGCSTLMACKPGATRQQELTDAVECRALAEQGLPPGGLFRASQVEAQYRACLEGRHYHILAKGETCGS